MKASVESRLKELEASVGKNDKLVTTLTICCAKLMQQLQKIEEDLQNLIADIEGDNNSSIEQLGRVKKYLAKITTSIQFLDAKNTALATIVCRELDLDPDMMTKEYSRVLSDLGQVDNFLEVIKAKVKKS